MDDSNSKIKVTKKIKKEKGIWIVGDVHGCLFELEQLLTLLPSDSHICFVGDLVDRGDFSKEVVNKVLSNDKYDCVIGNHELMAILKSRNWWRNGGEKTLSSFGDDYHELTQMMKQKMPLYHYYEFCDEQNILDETIKPLLVTHTINSSNFKNLDSNLLNKYLIEEEIYEDNELVWNRPTLYMLSEEYPFFNIFGHTILKEPFINNNFAMIDTGCIYGHKLSAIHYPSLEVIQVDSMIEPTQKTKNLPSNMEEFQEQYFRMLAMSMIF